MYLDGFAGLMLCLYVLDAVVLLTCGRVGRIRWIVGFAFCVAYDG